MPVNAALISVGGNLAAGMLMGGGGGGGGNSDAMAAAQLESARIAAEAQAFRPVGVTTRYGTSNFTMDGNKLTGASYTASPELKAYQDWVSQQTGGAMSDAERLLSLGRGYVGESPEEVRQRYINQQTNLLNPQNERTLAGIRNNLYQTGRSGLATGATDAGGMAATNPEMAAYYNALAQQQAALAAGADQAAQQQVTYGQGLLSSAYSPFQTNIGMGTTLEELARSPLDIGSALGAKQSTAGANVGQSLLQGGLAAAQSMYGAKNTVNPWASAISGAANNPYLLNAVSRQQPAQNYSDMYGWSNGGTGQVNVPGQGSMSIDQYFGN